MNLLYRYITQGRVEAGRPHLSPRRVPRMLLTRPDALSDSQQALLGKLTAACPEMTSLAGLVHDFAALLVPDPANQARLGNWAEAARAVDLPSLHAFSRTPQRLPRQHPPGPHTLPVTPTIEDLFSPEMPVAPLRVITDTIDV